MRGKSRRRRLIRRFGLRDRRGSDPHFITRLQRAEGRRAAVDHDLRPRGDPDLLGAAEDARHDADSLGDGIDFHDFPRTSFISFRFGAFARVGFLRPRSRRPGETGESSSRQGGLRYKTIGPPFSLPQIRRICLDCNRRGAGNQVIHSKPPRLTAQRRRGRGI